MNQYLPFRTEDGTQVPGVSGERFEALLSELHSSVGVLPVQSVEAASFSLAMVVRVALGLSGEGARVGIAYSDTLTGWIALATARHLINSGGSCPLLPLGSWEGESSELVCQMSSLRSICDEHLPPVTEIGGEDLKNFFNGLHALIVASYDPLKMTHMGDASLFGILNDLQLPIHSIGLPYGVNPVDGTRAPNALLASTTISLGVPLGALSLANEFVGRHYLCDFSFPRALYQRELGGDVGVLFAKQPVIQLFPNSNSDE